MGDAGLTVGHLHITGLDLHQIGPYQNRIMQTNDVIGSQLVATIGDAGSINK